MIDIKKKNGENSKLKISFVNPNSNKNFEALLKAVIIEKIITAAVVEGSNQ